MRKIKEKIIKITLQAALEICQFLVDECKFQYLMTAKLNQDNLEVCSYITVF